jgi:hypothetical protein
MGAKGSKGRKPSVMSQNVDSKGLNVDRGKAGQGVANVNLTQGTGSAGSKSFRKSHTDGDK